MSQFHSTRSSYGRFCATTSLTLAMLCSHAAWATDDTKKAAEVEADAIEYNQENSTVEATGNVNITYDERNLKAHKVEYNQNTDQIKAQTSVHITDEYENEYFADSAEVNGELTRGSVHNLSGHLAKKAALFSAKKGNFESQDRIILTNAAYTPCKVCKRVNNGKALWKLEADKVLMDRQKGTVSYYDSTLNILDVPVLYLPYFSHPSPEVKRRSGFLPFSYGQDSQLGTTLETPYFWNIAPNIDFTFSPIFTTKEGVVATGEFRHLTRNGSYTISGSITRPEARNLETGASLTGRETRGHIEGKGHFSLANDWSWGFDGKRATDRTYLDRYNFSNEELLTSQAYLQQVQERNFINIRSVTFQGLNVDDDNDTSPIVLPQVTTHHEGFLGWQNSKWFLDSNSLLITRETGAESRRISATTGVELPYRTASGHLFKAKASVRGDSYSVENVLDRDGIERDGIVSRFIPEVQLSWSYPLTKSFGRSRLVIEPITDVIYSTNGNNPDRIPNEDSQAVELSDINLFSNNHFSGLDQVEGGFRSNYGFRGALTHPVGDIGFLFGQSYSADVDNKFTEESGLNNHFSDYVGRVTISNDNLNIFYRFRADESDFKLHRNEIGAEFRNSKFNARLSYAILDEDDTNFDREEVTGRVSWNINDAWTVSSFARRDLTNNEFREEGWIDAGGGLVYENQCLRITTGIRREFTRDADIEPSTSYTVKFTFKGLGE